MMIIRNSETDILHAYNRYPMVLEHGERAS